MNIAIDLKPILDEAAEQIKTLAIESGTRYRDEVIAAGEQILTGMKIDLAGWTQLLAEDRIKPAEFALLVKSYKTELAMSGLNQAGMAQIRSVELGLKILDLIISIVLKVLNKIA